MYNLNNKNTTSIDTMRVKTHNAFVIKTFIGCVFWCVSAFLPMISFALWLDTKIQNALESLRPQDAVKDLYWSKDLGGKVDVDVFRNMYTKSYRLASVQEDATEIQTIAVLKTEIMNTYKCEITDREADILFKNGGKYITAKGCLPLIHCRDGEEFKEKKKKEVSNTELNSCKAFVTTKYEQTYKAIYDSATLVNTTLWTDIYANGTLDDGWFDILYDIQKIGDVLFAENDETAKTLFFSFPNGSIAWLQAISFDGWTNNGLPDTIDILKEKSDTQEEENTDPTDKGTRRDEEWGRGSNSDNVNKESVPAQSDPTISDSSNSDISNYACFPDKEKDKIEDQETDEDNEPEDDKENIVDTENEPLRQNRYTVDINLRQTNKPLESQNRIANNTNWDDPGTMEANQQEMKSCIKKCTDSKMWFSDKVFCVAKCSCTTKWTDNWMVWFSICMVPTSQADVLWNAPIQSLQEVIKEINNILTALKNSWELIKHTKPKEFLDTSLSKIQLNKIFAFDVNIVMKPIFSANPKKKEIAKKETETDRMANWWYPDIDIGKEKNKYAFYRNNWLTGSITENTEEANKKIKAMNTIQESQSQALIKTQNAQIIEWVRNFILDNIVYWDSIAEIVSSIQKTSDQIKQKIINK